MSTNQTGSAAGDPRNTIHDVTLNDRLRNHHERGNATDRGANTPDSKLNPDTTADRPRGAEESDPGLPRKRLGDFELIRELGSGGMGIVYEAEQISMGRRVALKILPMAGALHDKQLQRFRNEVRAAAMLDHTNIVSVYSVGEDRGIHYYAMQLIGGPSLAQVLSDLRKLNADNPQLTDQSVHRVLSALGSKAVVDRRSDFSHVDPSPSRSGSSLRSQSSHGLGYFRWVAQLGIQVASALQHAHDQGVLHRDIKPGNLLIDSDAQLYVTDFGLARIDSAVGMTLTGDLVGTLRYMSPEQALAKRELVGNRSDIYSLGASLYELLTLAPVFAASDRQELLQQIAFEEPVSPSKINPSVPKDLETIILKTIAKDSHDRYGSARDVADDLQRFLDDRPIQARRPTPLDRAAKLVRRHQRLTAAVVLLLTVITIVSIAGTLVYSNLYNKAEKKRLEADAAHQRTEQLREVLRQDHYALDLSAAYDAWNRGWIEEVDEQLANHIPAAHEPDLRSFGWHALRAVSSYPPPIVFSGHVGAVREVAMHPNGKWVVSAGDDGTVRIWDLETQKILRTIYVLDNQALHALAISSDGKRFATGGLTLQLWDLEHPTYIRTLTSHETTIEEAAFSADDQVVASAARSFGVRVTAVSGEHLADFVTDDTNETITFCGDSRLMGLKKNRGSSPDTIQFWNYDTGEVEDEVHPEYMDFSLVRPSQSGEFFAAALRSHARVLLVTPDTADKIDSSAELRGKFEDIALSFDDTRLAAGSDDGMIHHWRVDFDPTKEDIQTQALDNRSAIKAHDGGVTSLTFTDDGRLVSCGEDGLIKVWEVVDSRQFTEELPGRHVRVGLTPDGSTMLVADEHGTLQLLDASSGDVRSTLGFQDSEIGHIVASRDSQRFAIASAGGHVVVVDANGLADPIRFQLEKTAKALEFNPDGSQLAVTGVDGYSRVWDIESGDILLNHKMERWGQAVTFSDDGSRLALAGQAQEILVFEADQTKRWRQADSIFTAYETRSLRFHPSEPLLASGHADANIRMWNLDEPNAREPAYLLRGNLYSGIRNLVFDPTGRCLIAAGNTDAIRVWHLGTRRRLGILFPLDEPRIVIRQLGFTPGGDFRALGQTTSRSNSYVSFALPMGQSLPQPLSQP